MARFRICPREGQFGIQIPKGAWHSFEVLEPSAIFEAKDGGGMGSDTHLGDIGLRGERSNVPREALLYGAENDDKLRIL